MEQMKTFTHKYSKKNDGSPSAYTPMQIAIGEAEMAFNERFRYTKQWEIIAISKDECDDKKHYPDLCWHFTIRLLYE
jgi:hypothetical protein